MVDTNTIFCDPVFKKCVRMIASCKNMEQYNVCVCFFELAKRRLSKYFNDAEIDKFQQCFEAVSERHGFNKHVFADHEYLESDKKPPHLEVVS